MAKDYRVFVCNTKELAEQHGMYCSPGGGPFYAVRQEHSDGMGPEYVWHVCARYGEDGAEHIFNHFYPLRYALPSCDSLNAACMYWADLLRKDER